MEELDIFSVCLEDVALALQAGAAAAADVVLSYLEELQQAPEHVLTALVTQLREYLCTLPV